MKWNYRVVFSQDDGSYFTIREVYYKENGSIDCWSDEVAPYGETTEEIQEAINRMRDALNRPFLKEKTVEGKQVLVEEDKER